MPAKVPTAVFDVAVQTAPEPPCACAQPKDEADPAPTKDPAPVQVNEMTVAKEPLEEESAANQQTEQSLEAMGDLAAVMAKSLCAMIETCDLQYVRLEQILTKEWLRDLMRFYRRLLDSDDSSLLHTQKVSPLIEFMRERLQVQALRKRSGVHASPQKLLVKLDPEKLTSQSS